MKLPLTGSQTVGPFFAIGLDHLQGDYVPPYPADTQAPFVIEGTVFDGKGVPVPDVFLEIWQADATGVYPACDPSHSPDGRCPGFARVAVGPAGKFHFTTFKPGPVPYDDERHQAPHLLILLFMRGLLRNLVTRVYFPGEPTLAADPILELTPPDRRATLIATAIAPGSLHWNIVLRGNPGGPPETVFFEW